MLYEMVYKEMFPGPPCARLKITSYVEKVSGTGLVTLREQHLEQSHAGNSRVPLADLAWCNQSAHFGISVATPNLPVVFATEKNHPTTAKKKRSET